MNVPRNFLLLGSAFLVIGIGIGMYMGASGDHSLGIGHAHINLLGFTLSAIFALTYHAFPAMTAGRLAAIHFWLHLVGAGLLNLMLILLLTGTIGEAAMVPLAPISELLVMLGVLAYGWNVVKHAR